jgi:hypothetical protein
VGPRTGLDDVEKMMNFHLWVSEQGLILMILSWEVLRENHWKQSRRLLGNGGKAG